MHLFGIIRGFPYFSCANKLKFSRRKNDVRRTIMASFSKLLWVNVLEALHQIEWWKTVGTLQYRVVRHRGRRCSYFAKFYCLIMRKLGTIRWFQLYEVILESILIWRIFNRKWFRIGKGSYLRKMPTYLTFRKAITNYPPLGEYGQLA